MLHCCLLLDVPLQPSGVQRPREPQGPRERTAANRRSEAVRSGVHIGAPPGERAAGIGDDFQLKTASDQLKAWNIFARQAGATVPGGDRTAGR